MMFLVTLVLFSLNSLNFPTLIKTDDQPNLPSGADIMDYNFNVAIEEYNGMTWATTCSGIIVGPRNVVSAKLCQRTGNKMRVVAGLSQINKIVPSDNEHPIASAEPHGNLVMFKVDKVFESVTKGSIDVIGMPFAGLEIDGRDSGWRLKATGYSVQGIDAVSPRPLRMFEGGNITVDDKAKNLVSDNSELSKLLTGSGLFRISDLKRELIGILTHVDSNSPTNVNFTRVTIKELEVP